MVGGSVRSPPAPRRRSPDVLRKPLMFPTTLASFLELIRQHGDAIYSLMFAYAASHSLLLALFAGYAAQSGALSFGTLIAVCWLGSFTGDVIRFWIGRRLGTRWLERFPRFERAVQTATSAGKPSPCLDDLFPSLSVRHSRCSGLCLWDCRGCDGPPSWCSISLQRASGPASLSRPAMPSATSQRQ